MKEKKDSLNKLLELGVTERIVMYIYFASIQYPWPHRFSITDEEMYTVLCFGANIYACRSSTEYISAKAYGVFYLNFFLMCGQAENYSHKTDKDGNNF